MRKVLLLCLCVLSGSYCLAAPNCPDLSGTYRMSGGMVMQYQQNGCSSLTRTIGTISSDGTVSFSSASQTFQLDGTPLCDGDGRNCEEIAAEDGFITFDSSLELVVFTGAYGYCTIGSNDQTKLPNGDLQSEAYVYNCEVNEYAGMTTLVFPKL